MASELRLKPMSPKKSPKNLTTLRGSEYDPKLYLINPRRYLLKIYQKKRIGLGITDWELSTFKDGKHDGGVKGVVGVDGGGRDVPTAHRPVDPAREAVVARARHLHKHPSVWD